MNKNIVSIMGLGILAYGNLVRGNSKLEDNVREENTSSIPAGIPLNEYTSDLYKISFKYPRSWSQNPRYEHKYEGKTGFFEVSDFTGTGENIDEAVNNMINEPYKPYGNNPIVRSFIVDGQPARVIYPSDDQNSFFNDRDVALVVKYKQPIEADGETYDYVVIWSTREYMPLIISTFKFVS